MPSLIVFAREPIAGQTKTRLCPPLDGALAAALYTCFLQDVLHIAHRVSDVRCVIAYTPETAGPYFAQLATEMVTLSQCGDDLGERMDRALRESLTVAPPAVLIGSDIPHLPPNFIEMAFDRLAAGADAVFGPAEDGGYYLIGLRQPQPALLHDMPMSTPAVLQDTLQIARQLGLCVELLPMCYDIDTAADLQRLAVDLRAAPADVALHTRTFLASTALRHML